MGAIVGVFCIFLVVCFLWGLLKNVIENLFSYFWELLITSIATALVGWLCGGFWYVGAVIGAIYCIFCWITNKENKLASWIVIRGC